SIAKSPEDVEWWCLPHMCEVLNGTFLFSLLSTAFQSGTFHVAKSTHHCWVIGRLTASSAPQSFDLYLPSVGVKNLQTHLRETTGIECYTSFRGPLDLYARVTECLIDG